MSDAVVRRKVPSMQIGEEVDDDFRLGRLDRLDQAPAIVCVEDDGFSAECATTSGPLDRVVPTTSCPTRRGSRARCKRARCPGNEDAH